MFTALEKLRQHRLNLDKQAGRSQQYVRVPDANDIVRNIFRVDIEKLYQKLKALIERKKQGLAVTEAQTRDMHWMTDLGLYFKTVYTEKLDAISERADNLAGSVALDPSLGKDRIAKLLRLCADIANEFFTVDIICHYLEVCPPKELTPAVESTVNYLSRAHNDAQKIQSILDALGQPSQHIELIIDLAAFLKETHDFGQSLQQRLTPMELEVGIFGQRYFDALMKALPAVKQAYNSQRDPFTRWFMSCPGNPLRPESLDRLDQLATVEDQPRVLLGMLIEHYNESQDELFRTEINKWLRGAGLPVKEDIPSKLQEEALSELHTYLETLNQKPTGSMFCPSFMRSRRYEGYAELVDDKNAIPLLAYKR